MLMTSFVSKEERMKDLRIVVLGMTLTIVLAGVPNLYPVVMKEP